MQSIFFFIQSSSLKSTVQPFLDPNEVVVLMFDQIDTIMVGVEEFFQNDAEFDLLKLNGVEYQRDSSIYRTAVRLLLNHFNWDIGSLITSIETKTLDVVFNECNITNPRAYYLNVLFQDPSTNDHSNGTGKETCSIMVECDENTKSHDLVRIQPCFHPFCLGCLTSYVTRMVSDNQSLVGCIPCPQAGCKVVIDDSKIIGLLCNEDDSGNNETEAALSKYHRFIGSNFVEHNKYLTNCPTPNCSKVAQISDDPSTEAIECPDCLTLFCFICGNNWHEPLTCAQVKQFESFDHESLTWISRNTKKCPKCKWPIEKNKGCDHMTCMKCNHEFCWNCFADMTAGIASHDTSACRSIADQEKRRVNRIHIDQAERFKDVLKRIKPLDKLYRKELKFRQKLDKIKIDPHSLDMTPTGLRNLVREIGLSRLLITNIEIFSIFYRCNRVLDSVYQDRNCLEMELNRYLWHTRNVDHAAEYLTHLTGVASMRKRISLLLLEGLNSDKFESFESAHDPTHVASTSRSVDRPAITSTKVPRVPSRSSKLQDKTLSSLEKRAQELTTHHRLAARAIHQLDRIRSGPSATSNRKNILDSLPRPAREIVIKTRPDELFFFRADTGNRSSSPEDRSRALQPSATHSTNSSNLASFSSSNSGSNNFIPFPESYEEDLLLQSFLEEFED